MEKRHPKSPLLGVSHRAIEQLRVDLRNPRKHSPRQVQQIANSIASFGFNVPILVDAADTVVAGHGRLMAAKQLGLAEVPVIVLEHLSAPQAKAFAIADNRLTEISTWDDALLAEVLVELATLRSAREPHGTGGR
ncbi:ParB/Srx family N-terminal domain-containing protein [Hydrogenophaga laconesensis]|uniref:ParB/RepB/Spo0J family partition protein n=1 Tax=Hydrogenophaga laconesensis TaxID=1805971 RepID=A0ABU1V818_9BURK|nr:ParB/Srx family N-terminal domain-containing protein [Hydrogenophaga laconesensis]MDR7093610.1 ParB/RepB/Spo0J family partition protein [Hydrogenophaga laconesensis]